MLEKTVQRNIDETSIRMTFFFENCRNNGTPKNTAVDYGVHNPRRRRRGARATLVVAALWFISLSASNALSCSDPSLHPELAEFTALVDSLGPQPASPVSTRYKITDGARVGQPMRVQISFWPIEPYISARFLVTPSADMEILERPDSNEIPYKGKVTVVTLPKKSGYHYLKLETIVELAGETKHRINMLALPVGLSHSRESKGGPDARFGFAGKRLRESLTTLPTAETAPGTSTPD